MPRVVVIEDDGTERVADGVPGWSLKAAAGAIRRRQKEMTHLGGKELEATDATEGLEKLAATLFPLEDSE